MSCLIPFQEVAHSVGVPGLQPRLLACLGAFQIPCSCNRPHVRVMCVCVVSREVCACVDCTPLGPRESQPLLVGELVHVLSHHLKHSWKKGAKDKGITHHIWPAGYQYVLMALWAWTLLISPNPRQPCKVANIMGYSNHSRQFVGNCLNQCWANLFGGRAYKHRWHEFPITAL